MAWSVEAPRKGRTEKEAQVWFPFALDIFANPRGLEAEGCRKEQQLGVPAASRLAGEGAGEARTFGNCKGITDEE